jgi:hypothetical protein
MRKAIEREGKRAPLSMRTTGTLRARLEAAASVSGRSLAAEVEARLEGSFGIEDTVRVVRETVRAEMRAEFEGRRDPYTGSQTVRFAYQVPTTFDGQHI